jgi:hypothetical protein
LKKPKSLARTAPHSIDAHHRGLYSFTNTPLPSREAGSFNHPTQSFATVSTNDCFRETMPLD